MKKEKEASRDQSSPKHPCVKTQLMPDDVSKDKTYANEESTLTEEEIIESVVEINPDINSMDSRG